VAVCTRVYFPRSSQQSATEDQPSCGQQMVLACVIPVETSDPLAISDRNHHRGEGTLADVHVYRILFT
jgi:hypothetical protein